MQSIITMAAFAACAGLVRSDSGYVSTNDVNAGYVPANDVNAHSTMALDVIDASALLAQNDTEGALDIYVNGKNRPGSSLQAMANKDWAANGSPDDIKEAYERVLGPDFLDSYTLDAINCNNTFEGKSAELCSISATKNLICTMLSYAQYEGSKAVATSSEVNWDELFAFWNGVYNETVSEAVGQGSPGYVQSSRDDNFGTNFKLASLSAIAKGRDALAEDDMDKLRKEFDAWNAAQVATFAQAAVKYAYELGQPGADVDAKWAEGYTYFRCAAGLFDEEFAKNVDALYRTTDKDQPVENLYCEVAREVVQSDDLGYGVTASDLNLKAFLPEVESDCGVTIRSAAFSVLAGARGYSLALLVALVVLAP